MKRLGTLFLCGLLLLSTAGDTLAFHDGGAADCATCHLMHPSRDGFLLLAGAEPLLLAPSATDLCLMCHDGEYGVMGQNPISPPAERGAGNFVFLLEDNINDGPDGQSAPTAGAKAGHSIVSLSQGLTPDPEHPYSPGGNFPSSELGCTSCHDPHGNRNFRMLNGVGPVQGGLFAFNAPAPDAVGLDVRDPLDVESNRLHTAYRDGMSDWCANCHGRYHDQVGRASLEHDFDLTFGSDEMARYNRYNGPLDPRGGLAAFAYLAAVPFEDGAAAVDAMEGPGQNSRVMCLTCHRAHASSAPRSLRWDPNVQYLAQDGQVSGSYPIPAPYPDPQQPALCVKCHQGIPD